MDNKIADRIIDYLFKMEQRLTAKIDQHYDEFVEFKGAFYSHIDSTIGELKTTRVEQSSLSNRVSEAEDRLEKIEKVPVIAHSIKR